MPTSFPILIVALSLIAASGCSGPVSAKRVEPESAPVPAKSEKRATVAFVHPKSESVSRAVSFSGEFRPYQTVDLHAKVAGYLKSISVDAGSAVQEGQTIATLEIPEMEADLAQAAAERNRTLAELARARTEIERAEASLKLATVSHDRLLRAVKSEPGIIAQQEIDEAAARKFAAEAQLASTKAALAVEDQRIAVASAAERRTKAMAAYTRIVAPFSGVITKRYADPGAMIQAGTASQTQAMPVVRLAEIRRLRLVATVPESAVPLVREGLRVEIKVPSINRMIPASISRLARDLSPASRTMEAEIDVANPGSLTPGMYADVAIRLDKPEPSLTVPVATIINSGGNRSVWVVSESSSIEERPIVTGFESGSSYEVLSGLLASDRVIVSNRSLLKPGQTVVARAAGEN